MNQSVIRGLVTNIIIYPSGVPRSTIVSKAIKLFNIGWSSVSFRAPGRLFLIPTFGNFQPFGLFVFFSLTAMNFVRTHHRPYKACKLSGRCGQSFIPVFTFHNQCPVTLVKPMHTFNCDIRTLRIDIF